MLSREEKLELLELEQELEYRKPTRKFAEFVKPAWNVVEPSREYVHGYHIDAIGEHLEAVVKGQIRNLIINMPPRHMKSTLLAICFPAWVWIRKPNLSWLFFSYSHNLSKRDSVKCRRLIESEWYRERFKIRWRLSDDQNEKSKFSNTEQGFRIATSIKGTGTGEGGDFLVYDDPHNAKEIHSKPRREEVIDHYDSVFSSRGNDARTVSKIVIMQRLHQKDLVGHILEKSGSEWDKLILPAEYEGKKVSTSIGWIDPRKEIGDLLWPERFGKQDIQNLKRDLGEMGSAGQLQQRPAILSGNLFKRHNWGRYKELPKTLIRKGVFVDCASKPGVSNDWTVFANWIETQSGFYVKDILRIKVAYPQLKTSAKDVYASFKPDVFVIEDTANGVALIQDLKAETKIPVFGYQPREDKLTRAIRAHPTIEAGNVWLPESAPWVEEFIKEHENFPNSEFDDQVDTTSLAISYFKNMIKVSGPLLRQL